MKFNKKKHEKFAIQEDQSTTTKTKLSGEALRKVSGGLLQTYYCEGVGDVYIVSLVDKNGKSHVDTFCEGVEAARDWETYMKTFYGWKDAPRDPELLRPAELKKQRFNLVNRRKKEGWSEI